MNYIVRNGWSVQRTIIAILSAVLIFLLVYIYSSNDYFFGDEVRWAHLSYSTDREHWQPEIPADSVIWIRGQLFVEDSINDFDGLLIGLSGDYEIYWDSVRIGQNGTASEHGTIQCYQHLDTSQLSVGEHLVELHTRPSRMLYADKLFAGVILGNLQRFSREPFVQFACIAVVIGLLVMVWASLYVKEWHSEVLWLIGSIVLYLALNYTKVFYNYPVHFHDWRLLLYGFTNVLLSTSLISYTLGQIGVIKFKRLLLPVTLLLSLVFLIPQYDSLRLYILMVGQVISMTLLLANINRIKISFLLVIHIYLLVTLQFERGLLMVIGYVLFALLEYVESILPQPVEMHVKEPPEHLMATFGGNKKMVLLSEVVAIKGANNYTELILANQERYLCDQSLKQISENVPDYFLRIHKSYIVDLRRVDTIHTNRAGGKVLTMKNQIEFPVGRAYKHDLIDRLNQKI